MSLASTVKLPVSVTLLATICAVTVELISLILTEPYSAALALVPEVNEPPALMLINRSVASLCTVKSCALTWLFSILA